MTISGWQTLCKLHDPFGCNCSKITSHTIHSFFFNLSFFYFFFNYLGSDCCFKSDSNCRTVTLCYESDSNPRTAHVSFFYTLFIFRAKFLFELAVLWIHYCSNPVIHTGLSWKKMSEYEITTVDTRNNRKAILVSSKSSSLAIFQSSLEKNTGL